MKTKIQHSLVLVCLGTLSACLVPASLLERSSYPGSAPSPAQPDYWQSQGRYRQGANPSAPAPAAPAAPTTGQTQAGTSVASDPTLESLTPAPISNEPQAAPLLAWDGGVVDGSPQGVVTEDSGTPRGIEAPPAGRMHIIELYQQVLDERDALAEEVSGLNKALEKTSAALEEERSKTAQLETRIAALEEGHKGLLEENRELASRLTTAQIRRLEAEKLLLENRIDAQRARAAEAAQAQAKAQAKGEAGKKKADKEPAKDEHDQREGGGS